MIKCINVAVRAMRKKPSLLRLLTNAVITSVTEVRLVMAGLCKRVSTRHSAIYRNSFA